MGRRRHEDDEFVQSPKKLLDTGVSFGAMACYLAILEFAWGPGGEYFRAQAALAERLGVSDRQIRRYIDELKEACLVEVEQRGRRWANKITVCEWSEISWIDRGDRTPESVRTSESPTRAPLRNRTEMSEHLRGERTSMSGVTGQECPFPREEETLKKTPSKQEDLEVVEVVVEGARKESTFQDAVESDWWINGWEIMVEPQWVCTDEHIAIQDAFDQLRAEQDHDQVRENFETLRELHPFDLRKAALGAKQMVLEMTV